MESIIEVVEPKLYSGAVADEIVASVNDAINERGSCSIALSGGSTPGAIYRMMTLPPRAGEIDWSKVKLFWGDERWVPHTDDKSNFKMVKETLLADLRSKGPQVFGVDTSLPTAEAGAEAYSATIQKEIGGSGPIPQIDVVLLGVGEDGHTASLFPGADSLNAKGKLCLAVTHPVDHGERVTMSSELLFAARKIIFIVKGEKKANVIQRVIEGQAPASELPARLYLNATGVVAWFLDSGAALKLSKAKL